MLLTLFRNKIPFAAPTTPSIGWLTNSKISFATPTSVSPIPNKNLIVTLFIVINSLFLFILSFQFFLFLSETLNFTFS
ncbi:hypothetical protein CP523_05745 [Clostridium septicum]|uniref:Uncharacterized protein n=1 Tax=Clostridium septicum TaxID=1504 RepID=A0A9N7JJZ4_CLOSE|nr:hypothetical protein CP523_05745 [Clostridium septicum]